MSSNLKFLDSKCWLFFIVFFIPTCAFVPVLDKTEEKQQKLQEVLDQLWIAKGDFRFKKPRIKISTGSIENAAIYLANSKTIEVEGKAYRICDATSKLESGLSILIGHELAHFFQNPLSELGEQCYYNESALTDEAEQETEADHKGIFNAYLAKYDIDITKDLLKNIYETYEFSDKTKDYPSLSERQAAAKKVFTKTDSLIALFEAGNRFYAIGEYELAIASYKRLLADFESKEIFNNIGVAYALESLKYRDENELAFIYPIEVDVNTKLTKGYGALGKDSEEIRKMLLANALVYFNRALEFDSNYSKARLNTACVLSMNGYLEASEPTNQKYLKEVKEWYGYQNESILLEGIRYGLKEDTLNAKERFQKVLQQSNDTALRKIAQINLDILNKKDIIKETGCPVFQNIEIPSYIGSIPAKYFKVISYKGRKCNLSILNHDNGIKIEATAPRPRASTIIINTTTDANSKFEENIIVGGMEANLDKYKCKVEVANTSDGYYQLIGKDNTRFLFKILDDGIINEWGAFTVTLR